jgi:hypothetical protein
MKNDQLKPTEPTPSLLKKGWKEKKHVSADPLCQPDACLRFGDAKQAVVVKSVEEVKKVKLTIAPPLPLHKEPAFVSLCADDGRARHQNARAPRGHTLFQVRMEGCSKMGGKGSAALTFFFSRTTSPPPTPAQPVCV